VSTFEIKSLTDSDHQEIQSAVENLFPNTEVHIDLNRTYADEKLVKSKIIEFFNNQQQMFIAMLKEDSIDIEIDENSIYVTLKLETPAFKIFKVSQLDDVICKHLGKEFHQEVEIVLKEIVVEIVNETVEETRQKYIAENVAYVEDARLISVKMGNRIFSSRIRSNQITMLPAYISDIKKPCDSTVLCGKVIDFGEKQYKNKNYDGSDELTPEFKTLFKWRMFDKTAMIDCVAFPNPKDCDLLRKIKNDDEIVCQGRISESNYEGKALSFMVSTIYKANEIDYSTIKGHTSKPAPSRYEYIFPKMYENNILSQTDIFNMQNKEEKVPTMLRDKSFVVFDLETTGLDTSTAKIIEISGVKIENGKFTETFSSLINPKISIPEEITRITTITNNDVLDAPSSELVMPDFFKFTRGCALVAHNIGYDFPILSHHSEPLGYIYENDLFDTLALAKQAFPHLKKYRLEFLSQHFNIIHENAHRAMSDALATAELLVLIAKEIDKKC
ncbi:MAG: exonuclease domain-containing protein, partial [Clostridia bacterium]|nr:exonuclease domain-containing protein [Clostridia bacterium]